MLGKEEIAKHVLPLCKRDVALQGCLTAGPLQTVTIYLKHVRSRILEPLLNLTNPSYSIFIRALLELIHPKSLDRILMVGREVGMT